MTHEETIGTLQPRMNAIQENYEYLTLFQLHRAISTEGRWRALVEAYRKTPSDSPLKGELKQSLPCYVPSCQFHRNRQKQQLQQYTGIHYLDIDFHDTPDHTWTDEEVDEKLSGMFHDISHFPWVVEAHRSASGHGAHILCWMTDAPEPDYMQQREHFLQMATTFCDYYGVTGQLDKGVHDVMRVMYVSYDPDAWFRPLHEWKPFFEEQTLPNPPLKGGDERPLTLVEKPKNFTKTLRGDAYKTQKDLVAVWKKRIEFEGLTRGQKKVVEHYLSAHQYTNPGRHNFWRDYILHLRYKAIQRDDLEPFIQYMTLLLKQGQLLLADDPLNRSLKEVTDIVDWVYSREIDDDKIKPIKEKPLLAETIHNYLEPLKLRHNLVKNYYEIQKEGHWKPITDEDVHSLQYALEKQIQKMIPTETFRRILHSDIVEAVNPLWEFVYSLPPWDGHDHIQDLADTVKVEPVTDKPLWEDSLKRWLVGMMASWLRENTVNHEVLVLIGEQGKYKSTWLRNLLPPVLKEYVTDWSDKAEINKDDRLMTAQFGLINMDEIDAMTDRQMNQVKSLITATVINERGAYRENTERHIHIASFCGSGNKQEFLTDATGNRRWLPFMVTSIDEPQTIEYNYEQLYAQIYQLLVSGYQYWLTQEDNQEVTERCKRFSRVTTEEELIRSWFEPIPTESDYVDAVWLSASEVIIEMQNKRYMGRTRPEQVGQILQELGFQQKRTKHGRKYHMMVRKQAQIEELQRKG